MLVKLKNTGTALRVVYDINRVARNIRPGQTVEIDLRPVQVRGYEIEGNKPTGNISVVEIVDPWPEDGTEVAPKRKQPLIRINNPRQARNLSEIAGVGMRQRQHDPAQPKEGDEIDPDLPDGTLDVEPVEQKGTHGDPIAANAARAARVEQQGETGAGNGDETKPDPKTASEMLARLEQNDGGTGMKEEDIIRITRSLVPVGTLPQRPRPGQIMAALRKQAKNDAEADEAKKGSE